jgi:hypothetical protein
MVHADFDNKLIPKKSYIKGGAMKKYICFTFILLSLLACGTVDHGFYNNVELEKGKYVTLYLDGTVQVRNFDGDEKGFWLSGFNVDHFVRIPPGQHKLMLYYFLNQAQYGYTQSSDMPFEYNFIEGKSYRIYPKTEDSRVEFLIEEYQPK